MARGEVLQVLQVPPAEPDAAWFARSLTGSPLPHGVRADMSADSPSMTLCTLIANLTTGTAILLGRRSDPVTIPLADLASGEPGSQQPPNIPALPAQAAGSSR